MDKKKSLTRNLRGQVFQGLTRPEQWRRLQLERLSNLLDEYEEEALKALATDLNKPPTEAIFEIIAIKQELKLTQENLKDWMRPKKIQTPISLKPGNAWISHEPLGCVLIIGPWNYPLSLTLQPLVSAFAAGNTAVLKPSEHSCATSKLIAKSIHKYFPDNTALVVEGDGEVAAKLIEESFDHIFFTGGSEIGKKIMTSAAKELTPITLELGGKSPAIIIDGADISITARRLIWGKGLNAGQTCIAPNHVLVKENLYLDLVNELKIASEEFYGVHPIESQDLGKIINYYHFNRLNKLLNQAIENEQVIFGGDIDEKRHKISPTAIKINNLEDPLLKDELFGPLLPILKIPDLNTALHHIKRDPKPLAMYMFGGTKSEQQKLLDETSSGNVCFNDVVLQAGVPELPFGGVGQSGIGRYHGWSGFETFSNQRSVFKRSFWLDLKFRYPPYSNNIGFLKNLLS